MGLSLFALLFDRNIWMVLSSLGVEAAFIDLSLRVSIGIRLSSALFTGLSFLHKTRIPVFRINVSLLCRTTPHCAVRPVDGPRHEDPRQHRYCRTEQVRARIRSLICKVGVLEITIASDVSLECSHGEADLVAPCYIAGEPKVMDTGAMQEASEQVTRPVGSYPARAASPSPIPFGRGLQHPS